MIGCLSPFSPSLAGMNSPCVSRPGAVATISTPNGPGFAGSSMGGSIGPAGPAAPATAPPTAPPLLAAGVPAALGAPAPPLSVTATLPASAAVGVVVEVVPVRPLLAALLT